MGILKQDEARIATGDLCRQHGISNAKFYHWKAKYGGLEVSAAQRSELKQVEEENRKLKRIEPEDWSSSKFQEGVKRIV